MDPTPTPENPTPQPAAPQPPAPAAPSPQPYSMQPVAQSYAPPPTPQPSSGGKKKLIIGLAGGVALLALIGGGIFAAMSMNNDDTNTVAQKTETNSSNSEDSKPSDTLKPQPTKKDTEQTTDPTKYPASLRATYVNACDPSDKSACECEVDYFEKNYPVEKFKKDMEPGTNSAEYDDMFAKAFNACDK